MEGHARLAEARAEQQRAAEQNEHSEGSAQLREPDAEPVSSPARWRLGRVLLGRAQPFERATCRRWANGTTAASGFEACLGTKLTPFPASAGADRVSWGNLWPLFTV